MITYELQETRDVPGGGHQDVPGRPHGVRGVDDVRDIRSARSVRSGASRRPVPAGRVAGAGSARPVVATRRARPAAGRTRSVVRAEAFCPDPVARAPRTPVSPGVFRMRRLVAGAGLALASAVAVFGLGLLADVSSAVNGAPADPVTVLHGF